MLSEIGLLHDVYHKTYYFLFSMTRKISIHQEKMMGGIVGFIDFTELPIPLRVSHRDALMRRSDVMNYGDT